MSRKTILTYLVCIAALAPYVVRGAEPIVYYSFDELGTVVADLSGHGYDGTPNGGVKLNDKGYLGKCFEFNGTGAYVQLARPVQDSFTLTAWIKADVPGRAGSHAYEGSGLFWSDVAGVANDFVVAALGTKLSFFNGNPDLSVNSTADIVTGDWMHIAAVRDTTAQTISVYIDGKLDNSISHSNVGPLNAQAVMALGGNTLDSRYFTGLIDEVKIYDVALTAAEIKPMAPPKLKARKPNPADGTVGVTMPLLQWTKGDTALFHNVYLGTTPELTEANLVGPRQFLAMLYYIQGLQPGTTYWWRVDEIDIAGTVITGDVWTFTSEPLKAYAPKPADGSADLFPSQTLSWSPGKAAIKHQVYFSSIPSDVEGGKAAADKGQVTATKLASGLLRAATAYFWRVDELKADGTVEPGPVWSFTTEAGATQKIARVWWLGIGGTAVSALTGSADYPNRPTDRELLDAFEGPTDWTDNYGTRMYGWLTPPESGDYTFWIASDDNSELWLSTDADPANALVIARVASYTNSQEWGKEAGQKSAAIKLQAGQRYFLQALHKEGTGGDNLAVSWQGPGIASQEVIKAEYVDSFALAALQAFSPSPANGAIDALQDGALSWSAGEKAAKHDVYFGDDQAAIAAAEASSPLFKGSQAGTTFDAGDLEWGKTYFWRIDEVNPAEADSPWKGAVWSFTTANFIPVESFESYTDDEGNRIYEFWIDGWTNGTGSTVGNIQAPFAERAIVHGGKQSMPMDYNNIKTPFYSEAETEFSPLQNWTVNGVTDLTVFFRGRTGNGAGALYVAVEDSAGKVAVATNPDATAVTLTAWTEWKVPLSSLTGVNLAKVKKLYLGVGDRKAPTAGGAGRLYLDDIRVSKP